jgi:hypothetical protein
MTFQIVSAKYAVLFKDKTFLFYAEHDKICSFDRCWHRVLIFVYNKELQEYFTKTATMFVIFSFGIPLYF